MHKNSKNEIKTVFLPEVLKFSIFWLEFGKNKISKNAKTKSTNKPINELKISKLKCFNKISSGEKLKFCKKSISIWLKLKSNKHLKN